MKLAAQKFFVRATFGSPTWKVEVLSSKGASTDVYRGEVEG